MANTTSFGWEIPDDTDLVKDGAAAMRTLGNAIDSSMTDLKGGTTGQVLSKASGTDMDFTWVAQDDSNAIQNALLTTTGDTIYASAANTPARLGIGTSGQILTVNGSGLPAWATPAGSGGMTLLSTTSWSNGSGGSVTVSGISQSYKHLMILAYSFNPSSANNNVTMNPNGASNSAQVGLYSNAGGTATIYTRVGQLFEVYPVGITSGTTENSFQAWIYNYTSSAIKPMTCAGSVTAGGARRGFTADGADFSGAVTSIVFNVPGANSISGGTILIYGVN